MAVRGCPRLSGRLPRQHYPESIPTAFRIVLLEGLETTGWPLPAQKAPSGSYLMLLVREWVPKPMEVDSKERAVNESCVNAC